jgi:transposase-like protein
MLKGYSSKLKFQIVRELVSLYKSIIELPRAYGGYANIIQKWERMFNERGLRF